MAQPIIPGNLSTDIRNVVRNPDGSVSTVRTISIGTDNGEVLIPTVVGDRVLSDEEAIQHYNRTGENFGTFASPQDATKFAQTLHQQHETQMAQANPFDQFDPKPAEAPPPPGPSAMEGNPFDAPTAPSGKLSLDEYQAQLYRRLNRGDRPEDIMAWSREVGREIVPNEEWVANLAARDAALANNQPGQYGRVITMQPGERAPGSTVADAGAIVRRAGNAPLFYFGDEAVAAGMALAQDGDFWKQYEDNWRRLNAQEQVDETVRPGAVLAGDVAGIGLSMMTPTAIYDKGVKLLMPQTAGRGVNLGVRSAVGAGTGAATGATAATGEGSVDDRFQFTEGGAAVGAGFGASFPLVAEAAGRLSRPIREFLFPNSERAMGERMVLTQEELAAAEAELARQKELGLEPTLLDVLPEKYRNIIGSAGAHDEARETLQTFAQGRTTQLPERVQRQADEVILPGQSGGAAADAAPAPEPSRFVMSADDIDKFIVEFSDKLTDSEILDELANRGVTKSDWENYLNQYAHRYDDAEIEPMKEFGFVWLPDAPQHAGSYRAAPTTPSITPQTDPALLRSPARMKEELDATRRAELDARMEPIRHNPVPMNDEVLQILATGQGQAAIRDAIDMESDPVLRQQLVALADNVKLASKIDPRLPAQSRQQITRQIMQTSPFTVNASEKISRALANRAKAQGADSGTLSTFSRTIRDAARTDPDFVKAMDAAQKQHRARESVELGEQFLRPSGTDEFVEAAEGLTDQSTARLRLPEDPAAAKIEYTESQINRALDRWQGSAASRITHALERGGSLSPDDAETLAIITRLINSERVGPEQLFRGIEGANSEEVAEILSRGNRAPKSHTSSEDTASAFAGSGKRGVVYDVQYAGRGLDLRNRPTTEGTANRDTEYEVILPPGRFVPNEGGTVTPEMLDQASTKEFIYGAVPKRRISGRYVADPLLPETAPAPSNRDLARVGAAASVRERAGQGPSEARSVAERFYDSPEQRRRTEALLGSDAAQNLAERMEGEVQRVYRANRQATREGPAREGGIQAVENFANAMYQPGSPIPWTREVARFLHRIGMREQDAVFIVTNAIDPTKTEAMIKLLEKQGMNRDRALVYIDELRDSLTRYMVAQEGGSE